MFYFWTWAYGSWKRCELPVADRSVRSDRSDKTALEPQAAESASTNDESRAGVACTAYSTPSTQDGASEKHVVCLMQPRLDHRGSIRKEYERLMNADHCTPTCETIPLWRAGCVAGGDRRGWLVGLRRRSTSPKASRPRRWPLGTPRCTPVS
ncbi:hypothetical protein BU16DRAFT_131537 [Lophium mytilinum]|uniref:Uncharacterized protein n=1 Tax=Lophium mytilinum TaxID=390894 RepID=A0A6A6QIR3_9PEZI|nr:hypothetical protein BU16DRAFT_131537 [Lophium mytilinum]